MGLFTFLRVAFWVGFSISFSFSFSFNSSFSFSFSFSFGFGFGFSLSFSLSFSFRLLQRRASCKLGAPLPWSEWTDLRPVNTLHLRQGWRRFYVRCGTRWIRLY